MQKKIRTLGMGLLLCLWLLLTVALWFGGREDYTFSERRPLAQMPELSLSQILDGKFMPSFEDFTLDQFPLRDRFRQLKSLFHYYVLGQRDNNGIYLVEDTVAKLEYPLNETSVNYATGRLQYLYDKYLQNTDCKIYTTLIPDKGYYLAGENGYPAMDYEKLEQLYQEATAWGQYVDIKDLLTARDYYRTDTHWRQEKILPVAHRLCQAMGVEVVTDYEEVTLDAPFYGVYFGQAALPLAPEPLTVLENDLLKHCHVTDMITDQVTQIYDLDKADSPDLYEVFLSGAQPLLRITNPQSGNDRELVVFRDSFGSSLVPLLVQEYCSVTLVDIRYISPDQLETYLAFDGQDVLFAYSTLILNNGRSLK